MSLCVHLCIISYVLQDGTGVMLCRPLSNVSDKIILHSVLRVVIIAESARFIIGLADYIILFIVERIFLTRAW